MITVIILAGGVGSRVGANRPKQFVEVLGKPVISYTIEIFQNHPEVDNIEVVCHENWKDYLEEIVHEYNYTKVKWVTDGGDTFQQSCINGVNNLKDKIDVDDYVLIQYGAAPFTSAKIVSDVIRVMKDKGSSFTATPCYQLLGSNDANGESMTWVDRDKFIQIACPYGFRYGYLLDIYKRAAEQGFIDTIEPHTTSLMYALGDTLYQAYGDQTNIKITTKEDFEMFEGYVLHSRRAGYISDESNCSYDDLWNKVNTRVHLQENCDKWNHLNVSVLLKPEEETLKTLMKEFFAKKNPKMFVRLMQELDFQGWI